MNALKIVSICLIFAAFVYSVEEESDDLSIRLNDITGTTPGSFAARDSVAVWLSLGVTAGRDIRSVAFDVSPSSANVGIAYNSGATLAAIGNIDAPATGYGSFQLIGPAGYYTLNFRVQYRRLGVWYNYTTSASLQIGDDGGDQRRFASVPSLDVRTTSDFTLAPGIYSARTGVPLWTATSISANANLKNVSYLVTPNSASVSIIYPPPPTGNYIGPISSGTTGYANFQITAPTGIYSLNITIQWKKGTTWYQDSQFFQLGVDDGTGTTGSGSFRTVEKDAKSVESNAVGTIGFGFLMGIAIGCVAIVAAAVIIAGVFVVVRQQKQNILA